MGRRGNYMTGRRSIQLIILALLICAAARPTYAQGTGASITGTLRDATGAMVPSAAVKASNIQSGRDWATVSNEVGIYNIPGLPPGQYTVAVEAAGFKRLVTNQLTLEVNQIARVDLALEVGAVADTVAITGIAPLLQTETSQVGNVVTGTTTLGLPLNG